MGGDEVIPNEKLKERVIKLMIEMFPNYGHPDDKIEEVIIYRENPPYKLFFVDTVKHGYFFVYNGVFDDFWVFEQDHEIKNFIDLFYTMK